MMMREGRVINRPPVALLAQTLHTLALAHPLFSYNLCNSSLLFTEPGRQPPCVVLSHSGLSARACGPLSAGVSGVSGR
jgi:hypothetical protein